jgi:hypothetical protein
LVPILNLYGIFSLVEFIGKTDIPNLTLVSWEEGNSTKVTIPKIHSPRDMKVKILEKTIPTISQSEIKETPFRITS